jgi:hypothetical protein
MKKVGWMDGNALKISTLEDLLERGERDIRRVINERWLDVKPLHTFKGRHTVRTSFVG